MSDLIKQLELSILRYLRELQSNCEQCATAQQMPSTEEFIAVLIHLRDYTKCDVAYLLGGSNLFPFNETENYQEACDILRYLDPQESAEPGIDVRPLYRRLAVALGKMVKDIEMDS